ncbi:hypothetical protein QBC46DRAFT_374202 [Diplogelasinospora grovesii]|uniref:Uncharacterized protein n=1 Tax=Diplogelasinospora grovesii TaxID=303347 RepID=A0AAN6S8U5_9PEZI|nr:hypothetical protein QBC46DRAFT_374202 [Diplogelasinospora grovesii]
MISQTGHTWLQTPTYMYIHTTLNPVGSTYVCTYMGVSVVSAGIWHSVTSARCPPLDACAHPQPQHHPSLTYWRVRGAAAAAAASALCFAAGGVLAGRRKKRT